MSTAKGFLNLQKFWVLFLIKLFLIKQFSLVLLCSGRFCYWTFLLWEIVVLDYFALGDSTAGLFCCGRFYCWTFLPWEILILDFLASGQMNRQAVQTCHNTMIQIDTILQTRLDLSKTIRWWNALKFERMADDLPSKKLFLGPLRRASGQKVKYV